jgi:magnesium transporter
VRNDVLAGYLRLSACCLARPERRLQWSMHRVLSSYASKVQFLLDAILGFITIQQNDLFKILTIVSVVGIPPTLVAGIYGMNFKYMPELNWIAGYPFGLAMIALSALIPLAWFKWRNWF